MNHDVESPVIADTCLVSRSSRSESSSLLGGYRLLVDSFVLVALVLLRMEKLKQSNGGRACSGLFPDKAEVSRSIHVSGVLVAVGGRYRVRIRRTIPSKSRMAAIVKERALALGLFEFIAALMPLSKLCFVDSSVADNLVPADPSGSIL